MHFFRAPSGIWTYFQTNCTYGNIHYVEIPIVDRSTRMHYIAFNFICCCFLFGVKYRIVFVFFLICRRLHCHAIWTSSWRCVYHGLQLPSVRSTSFLYRFKQFWWQAGLWINCFLSPYSHDLKMACIVWQNKWKVDFPLWKVNGEEHLGYCKKCLAILTKLRNW